MIVPLITFFDFVIYICAVIISYKCFKYRTPLTKGKRYIVFFLAVLFCIIPFWGGDYFHYMEVYPYLKEGGYQLNVEPIYSFIAYYTSDYHVFRLIIWGVAIVLVCGSFKLQELDFDTCLFIFSALFVYQFSYARVSLSMAIMFFGVSLMYTKERKYHLIGLALLASSFFFHKSALFGIATIIISSCFLNMTKSKLKLLLYAFPILIFAIQFIVEYFLSISFDREEGEVNFHAGQNYMTADAIVVGPGEFIMNTFVRLTFYMIAYLYIKVVNNGVYNQFSKSAKLFATISFFTIYFASFFALDIGINSTVIYNRFLKFCIVPATFFLSYCYSHKVYVRYIKKNVFIGILAACYSLIYSTYLNYVDSSKFIYILKTFM